MVLALGMGCTTYAAQSGWLQTNGPPFGRAVWAIRSVDGLGGGGRRAQPRGAGLGGAALVVELRNPLQPARQVPVPVAEDLHRGRQQDAADDRRVDEDG